MCISRAIIYCDSASLKIIRALLGGSTAPFVPFFWLLLLTPLTITVHYTGGCLHQRTVSLLLRALGPESAVHADVCDADTLQLLARMNTVKCVPNAAIAARGVAVLRLLSSAAQLSAIAAPRAAATQQDRRQNKLILFLGIPTIVSPQRHRAPDD